MLANAEMRTYMYTCLHTCIYHVHVHPVHSLWRSGVLAGRNLCASPFLMVYGYMHSLQKGQPRRDLPESVEPAGLNKHANTNTFKHTYTCIYVCICIYIHVDTAIYLHMQICVYI